MPENLLVLLDHRYLVSLRVVAGLHVYLLLLSIGVYSIDISQLLQRMRVFLALFVMTQGDSMSSCCNSVDFEVLNRAGYSAEGMSRSLTSWFHERLETW